MEKSTETRLELVGNAPKVEATARQQNINGTSSEHQNSQLGTVSNALLLVMAVH